MHDEKAKKIAELAPRIMSAFHDLGRQHPTGEKLSMRQFQALIILNANEKLTISQICKKLSLAPSTGTELINRMIALDFVQKVGESADRRQVIISPTTKGIELLNKRQEMLTEMFTKFLTPFKPQDKQTFVESFERIWELIAKYYVKKITTLT